MNTKRLILLSLFVIAFALMACNLARSVPTPTVIATQPFLPTLNPGNTPVGISTPISVTGDNGQVCVIPPDWIAYTVEAGDSMSLLAMQTGATVDQLTTTNCMSDPNNLFEGQTLYLPRVPVVGG